MDAPGQPPAGDPAGPEGAAAGRGPSPEAAIKEEEAADGRSRTGKRSRRDRGCWRLGERRATGRGRGASILGLRARSLAFPGRGDGMRR
ncbi:hypothetical protein llap_16987 [Limosa lapponica baueri]|uniref:Uncharacterized protein n=1 Tax=Limosa lapponica baueri TaxID=1758121 RepID=A0A2I0TFY6_LIMLA|nr:hypothetical protein llap_16987 [Limosa lapponica baueri]